MIYIDTDQFIALFKDLSSSSLLTCAFEAALAQSSIAEPAQKELQNRGILINNDALYQVGHDDFKRKNRVSLAVNNWSLPENQVNQGQVSFACYHENDLVVRVYNEASDHVEFELSETRLKIGEFNSLLQVFDLAYLCAQVPSLEVSEHPPVDLNWARGEFKSFSPRQKRKSINNILLARRPSAGLLLLDKLGQLDWLLPELTAGKSLSQNRFHAHDIFDHLLHACDGAIEADLHIRWSALLHDVGKVPTRKVKENGEASFHNHEMLSAKMVVPIMKRFAIPRPTGQKIKFLVRNHMFHYTNEWTDKAVRRFIKKISQDDLQDLISLRLADRKGSGKKTAFPKSLQKLIDHIDEVYAEERKLKVKDLEISGHDLQEMGIEPGPQMGKILKQLLAEVVDNNLANEEEALHQRAKELISLSIV